MSQICLILCISTDIRLVQGWWTLPSLTWAISHLGPALASTGLQASTPSPVLCTQESAWAFQKCHSGYVIPLLKTLLPIFLWIKVKHGSHPCLCLNVCLAWHSLSIISKLISCYAPIILQSSNHNGLWHLKCSFLLQGFCIYRSLWSSPNFQGDSIFSSYKSQLKLYLLREAFSEHPSQGSPHPRIPSQPLSLTSHLLLPAVFIVHCLLMCSFNLYLTH